MGIIPATGGGFARITNDNLTQNADNWGIFRDNIPGTWSPDGKQLIYTKFSGSVEDQGMYLSDGVGPGGRINGFVGTDLQWVILNQSSVKVEILLPTPVFEIDEPFTAQVKVTSHEELPQTVSFPNGLLTSRDGEFLELEFESVESFELAQRGAIQTFDVGVTPGRFGGTELTSEIEVTSPEGAIDTVTATGWK